MQAPAKDQQPLAKVQVRSGCCPSMTRLVMVGAMAVVAARIWEAAALERLRLAACVVASGWSDVRAMFANFSIKFRRFDLKRL